ncbi:MAG: peptidase S74, partial [Acidobacteria bacterium]|nr:peptidase S74 [Acidobacteriota bacterium]
MARLFVSVTLSVYLFSSVFAFQARAQETTGMATASGPRLVQFSGTLKDQSGQPLSGVQGITFTLYREQSGGAPLWLETQNVQLDEQGRYGVLLGAVTSDGLPQELFSSGEARWLGVQVNLPGEPEQPRVLLVSVPYALKAADAETLGGLPASAFVLAKSAVASTSLLADKAGLPVAAFSDGFTTAAVSGTGTTNKVVKWTDGAAGTLGDSA